MNTKTTNKWLFWVIASIPPIVFVLFVLTFTQNLIVLDDYNMIGNPFIRYMESETFLEKLKAIFSQQNEYRFPILSTWSILQYRLLGELRFNLYPLYGNFALVAMCLLVVYVYGKKERLPRLLPIVYLMFPLHIYIIIVWANASCQYLPAFAYSLLTMYFLAQDNPKTQKWAFLTGFLGAFSFGSGLFGILFGAVVLLIRKSYKLLAVWSVFVVIIFVIYFTGYRQTLSEGSLNNLIYKTSDVLLGFLYIWGGWADLFYSSHPFWSETVPMLAGIATVLLMLYVTKEVLVRIWQGEKDTRTIFTAAALGFLGFTTAVIAISRIGDDPEFTMLVSNHRYYAFIGVAIAYGWFLDSIRSKLQWTLFGTVAVVYFLGVVKFIDSATNRAKDLATEKFNHYRNGVHEEHRYFSDYYLYQTTVDADLRKYKAYVFPATAIHKSWNSFDTTRISDKKVAVNHTTTPDGIYLLQENAGGNVLDGIYYLFQSDKKLYVYYPKRKVFESLNPFARNNEYDVFVSKYDLEEGKYDVLICDYKNKQPSYSQTRISWDVKYDN